MHANPIIGVDGGGTSCRARIWFPSGAGQRDEIGGPANVSDFDGAMGRIGATLDALLAGAGRGPRDLSGISIHLGLAGVTGPAMADRVRAALLADRAFGRVSVSGDNVTTILGALGGVDGAVAAIGTGSFVGRSAAGRVNSLGGRGFLLGDQASGGWLGKRLLQELMLAADGLRAHSDLTRAVLARHGDDVAQVIAFALAARPADFAALAPEVVAAATAGDPVAGALMGEGADYITAALAALGWRAGETLCLTGGIGPLYRPYLPAPAQAALTGAHGSALDGAMMLARTGAAP